MSDTPTDNTPKRPLQALLRWLTGPTPSPSSGRSAESAGTKIRGWMFCDISEYERGFSYVERAVGKGYFASLPLSRSPQFDAIRDRPAFQSLLANAEAGRQRALAPFRAAGGERLLGR